MDEILDQWARERPDLDASPIGLIGRLHRLGDVLNVELLERITADVVADDVPEFVPPSGEKLAALVTEDPPGNFRAPKGSQMKLMENRPLVRIPKRFHGIV